MTPSKKLYMVLILAAVLGVSFAPTSIVFSEEWSAPEKALSFLTDVTRLDVSKYNVTLTGNDETDVKYTLENNESKLLAFFNFVDNKLWTFHLYVEMGAPLFSEPPFANVLERAGVFLQRYLNYTDSDSQEMRDALANVTEIGNITTTVGNVLLELNDDSSAISFTWKFIFNGAEFYRFSLTFRQNGEIGTLDTRLINKIGSTDVNVTLEEAIDIAREFVENLMLEMGKNNPKYQNITLSSEPEWSLQVRTREPLTFYPYWIIGVRFNETVIDGAAWLYGVYVFIWADTGEIISSQPMAIIGLADEDASSSTSPPPWSEWEPPRPSPDELSDSSPEMMAPPSDAPPSDAPPQDPQDSGSALPLEYGYAVAAVSIIALATTIVLLKRKRGK